MLKRNRILLIILVHYSFFMVMINTSCRRESEIILRDNIDVKRIIENYDTIIPELMKKQNIPALSIALIDRKGMVWSKCYGYIDTNKKIPNTSETIFSIQSASKTITATAILIAVQEGLLNLDTPIGNYIPEFKINSYFDEDPLNNITLRHLLSHTAGLEHEAPIGNNFTFDTPSFEEHVNSIQRTSLRYPVGQRYSYSNLGIDLTAYILQVVSNKPFYQYLQEKIFSPLGMKNSSANPEVIRANKNRAVGHNRGREESRIIVPMQGAGGVYTSIDDLAKFVQFHLNYGKINSDEFLNPSLLDEMYTIPFPIKGQTSGYALGIDTDRKHNSLFLNHGGGGYGYLSDMAWYKEFGIGIVVLTNSTNHNLQGKFYNEILDKIIQSQIKDTLYALKEHDIQEFKLEREKKQNLVGNYIGRFGVLNLEIHDGFLGIKEGADFLPFIFYSENEVYLTRAVHYDYFRFILDKNGTPDYMVKLNGGISWDYNDGPNDKPGPDKPEWDDYTGEYRVYIGGNSVASAKLERKNGYLYVSSLNTSTRLTEIQLGIFVTCRGEILQFGEKILFASIFELVRN